MQSISLEAKLTDLKPSKRKQILADISKRINPAYLKRQLKRRSVPKRKCPVCGTTVYDCANKYNTIPTADLTLRTDEWGFHGSASGGPEQLNKLIVKALALESIQKILNEYGVPSVINYSDVEPGNYAILSNYIFR